MRHHACTDCGASGRNAIPCDDEECFGGSSHVHTVDCEGCAGLGVRLVCRVCADTTGTIETICEPCISDAQQADDFSHRRAS